MSIAQVIFAAWVIGVGYLKVVKQDDAAARRLAWFGVSVMAFGVLGIILAAGLFGAAAVGLGAWATN